MTRLDAFSGLPLLRARARMRGQWKNTSECVMRHDRRDRRMPVALFAPPVLTMVTALRCDSFRRMAGLAGTLA